MEMAAMTNRRELADAFLSRLTEDDTGIWELTDEARHRAPGLADDARFVLARDALWLLLTRGLVHAWHARPWDTTGSPLVVEEALALIDDQQEWLSPAFTDAELTVMLYASPAGEELYFAGVKLAAEDT